ncbi:MAG: hypothetical protein WC437_04750 [Patescibacteria group bacterium]
MIICKICNPQLEGNGYCAEHSTGGTAYQKDMRKETIENNWEEEIKLMIPLQGCGVSTNQIIEKIRTLLETAKQQEAEKWTKLIRQNDYSIDRCLVREAIKTLKKAKWQCVGCGKFFKSTITPSEIRFIWSESLNHYAIQGYLCKKCGK